MFKVCWISYEQKGFGSHHRHNVHQKPASNCYNKIEDTKEEHLELAVAAFDKLAEKAMRWVAAREKL
jgi:hypothetical protein